MNCLRPAVRAVHRAATKQVRAASSLTTASVAHLEARWDKMPEVDRQSLIGSLSERQKLPWSQLSDPEKKAAYYISFGEWGPRKPLYSKADKNFIVWGTIIGVGLTTSLYLFARSFRNVPVSMNREWQEKSDEYLESKNANPFHGYSQVQSK